MPVETKEVAAADEVNAAVSEIEAPECFYPWEHVKPEGKTCKSMKKVVKHSVFKLAQVAKEIKGKHLYDAQTILNNVDKKAALELSKLVNSARKNGIS